MVETGYVHFHYKTALVSNGGNLVFLINNVEVQRFTGTRDWTHFSVPILEGVHNFAWEFNRLASGSDNANRVWIDQIGFPTIVGHVLYAPTNLTHELEDRKITFHWDKPYFFFFLNPPDFLGYNIYQNQIKVNTSPVVDNTYTIANSTGGSMSFWVVAEYSTGESLRSNQITVTLPFLTPTNLTAHNEGPGVKLNWEFPVESHTLIGFRVHRNGSNITVPILNPDVFTYHDTTIVDGEIYTYHIRALFTAPAGMSQPSNEVEIEAVNEDDEIIPVFITELQGNHPNPFNPDTIINFSLANETNVKIEIFNVRGALVKTLINEVLPSGQHKATWNGTDNHGKATASGVYFYRMNTPEMSSIRRMVLLK
jgi:hypothetical protein